MKTRRHSGRPRSLSMTPCEEKLPLALVIHVTLRETEAAMTASPHFSQLRKCESFCESSLSLNSIFSFYFWGCLGHPFWRGISVDELRFCATLYHCRAVLLSTNVTKIRVAAAQQSNGLENWNPYPYRKRSRYKSCLLLSILCQLLLSFSSRVLALYEFVNASAVRNATSFALLLFVTRYV